MWKSVLTLVFFLLQGFQGLPLDNTVQHGVSDKRDKKGTIRIAGPWHSDSALDRNIDPGEDSYVKKIISTNEGINFNKDMAEAGEMFDVNGIEDFYDKNAMITYEVNGHEVPVHMKPKYTPQSKSMFPEYVRETPATIGLARHARPSSAQYQHPQRVSLKAISGFTSKDMPEYNVRDSPMLHGNLRNDELRNIGAQKFFHSPVFASGHFLQQDANLPWKTATSVASTHLQNDEQTEKLNKNENEKMNQQEVSFHHHDGVSHEQSEQDTLKKLEEEKLLKTIEQAKLRYERLHQINLVDQNHRVSEEDESKFNQGRHNEKEDLSDGHLRPLQFHRTPHLADDSESEGGRFIKGSEEDKAMLQHYLGDHDEISEFHHQVHNNYDDNHAVDTNKNEETTSLFTKLESLHQKLKSENEHTRDEHSHLTDEDHKVEGPEKTKAKVRILSLLGELSSKLKGMEAVVTSNHNVEGLRNDHEEKEISAPSKEKDVASETDDLLREHAALQDQHSNNEIVDKTTFQDRLLNFRNHGYNGGAREDVEEDLKSKVSPSNKFDETEHIVEKAEHNNEFNTYLKEKSKQDDDTILGEKQIAEENAAETARKIRLDEEKAIESRMPSKLKSYSRDTEAEEEHHNTIVPDIIDNFQEHKKPFVMDTSSIDYKPNSILTSDVDDKEEYFIRKSKANKKERQQNIDAKSEETNGEDDENDEEEHSFRQHKVKPQKHYNNKHKHYESEEKTAHGGNEKEETDEGSAKKVNDVAESLASADESNNGVARERTYHAKHFPSDVLDDIEYPDYNDVKDAAIFETNLLRKRYHANKLLWSDRLSDRAQQQAERLARIKDFDINKINDYRLPGENIAFLKFNSPNVGKDAIDTWEKESKDYDFRSPEVSRKNNDFIQLMWLTEKEFGMGVAKSKSKKGWIVTSLYDVPFVDKFRDLKLNLKSETPIDDPYSDITG